MGAALIDGRAIAAKVLAEVSAEVRELRAKGIEPLLAVVLVGEDPASLSYVSGKQKACAFCGILSETYKLPAKSSIDDVLNMVECLNVRPNVHGVLVQSPLPKGLDPMTVVEAVDPSKDVDGLHSVNIGKMIAGLDSLVPCTPAGIVELLVRSGHSPNGKHVVIVGRSNLVGRPLMNLLTRKGESGDATVTLCHSRTPDLGAITRQADILVVAVGKVGTVTAEMVKEGAVVIDVGMNRVPDPSTKKGYRLVGDVDFEGVSAVASAMTPVPGGVGQMTVAILMRNTAKAARKAVQR